MDLTFRELQRRLKKLGLGPVAGSGINKDVLLERYLAYKEGIEEEEKPIEEEEFFDPIDNYENAVKRINPSFYHLISSHVSNIPDIRPQETIQLMRNEERNIWRSIFEELNALSNIEGKDEDEERLLWEKISNKHNILEYVDEKRSVTNKFIEKYPIMFFAFLRAVKSVSSLLSSTRDEILNRDPFLRYEMKSFDHETLLMRNLLLIDSSPPLKDISFYSRSYGPMAPSLYAHALLHRTHQYNYTDMLNRLFGIPHSVPAINARLDIIQHYAKEMRITEVVSCILVLIYDIGFLNRKGLIHLFEDPFVQEILNDINSKENSEGRFRVPMAVSFSHRPEIRYISESKIKEERRVIAKEIIKTLDHDLIRSYWPLFYPLYKDYYLDSNLNEFIIHSMKETEEEEEFASMMAFVLYKVPGGEFILTSVANFTFPYTNTRFTSNQIDVLKFLFPLLSDEHAYYLFDKTRDAWTNSKEKRTIVNFIQKEGKKRGFK